MKHAVMLLAGSVAISQVWAGPADNVSLLRPVSMPPPRYPRIEACAGFGGKVVLVLDVDATGKVGEVVVEKSSRNRELDRAAVAAARSWAFTGMDPSNAPRRVRVPVDFEPSAAPADICPDIVLLAYNGKEWLPGDTFGPDRTIRLRLHRELTGMAAFEARWYRFDGEEKGVASGSFDVHGVQQVDLDLVPQGRWVPGVYGVDVFIDGQRFAMALFAIEE